jgi:type IV secretion system protein VirD4
MNTKSVNKNESLLLLLFVICAIAVFSVWLAGGIAMLITGHGWQEVTIASAPRLVLGVAEHPKNVTLAWPKGKRSLLGPKFIIYLVMLFVLFSVLGVFVAIKFMLGKENIKSLFPKNKLFYGTLRPVANEGAGWAAKRDMKVLLTSTTASQRLVIGKFHSKLLAVETNHSVLVVGPSQSGKTSGLAIPAILEWEGPIIATSVKTDLIRDTHFMRAGKGKTFVYDPMGISGLKRSSWSPLTFSRTWEGALSTAAGFCQQARNSSGGMEDAGFWYATAEKLIAPLLYAAANGGCSMDDVLAWIDTAEEEAPFKILESLGNNAAIRAAVASFSREDRQKSSVYTTAETVLAAFADPVVANVSGSSDFMPADFTSGQPNTLYLVSPGHFQQRLQSVFTAIIKTILNHALEESCVRGKALDPALLIVLDEAANIAPLDNLDTMASIAAGHGIQLLTVFQDVSQIEARYGTRWATVVNNHRAKVLCSSIADPKTLEHFSTVMGDTDRDVASHSYDKSGNWTKSVSSQQKRLAPADYLRRIQPDHAVLLYGHLPPVLMELRPFYKDRQLQAFVKP